jgi:hypothetical protein
MAHPEPPTVSHDLQHCIDLSVACHNACLSTAMHCLDVGGKHAESGHISLMLDCAELCQMTADFLMRGSERHAAVCAVCADVCRSCAEECSQLGPDDQQMQHCAKASQLCARACERMSSLGQG